MVQKVILDVDTGSDDAIAILMAGHHPKLELVAVTVTQGNAPLDVTLDNTLRVLQAGGLEHVPVYSGARFPLISQPISTSSAQKKVLPLPATTLSKQEQNACEFLMDYYRSTVGPETIFVPLAPQTNLAIILRIDPDLAKRIPKLVMMAGAYIEGNSTPSAEFNILADPEAARIVFSAGILTTMIGLEVTSQALITYEDIYRLKKLSTPQAEAAFEIIHEEIDWFQSHGWPGAQIFDACAIATIINPTILKTQPMHIDIELTGEFTRGRTVADISGRHHKVPNVDVGVSIDRDAFLNCMIESLGASHHKKDNRKAS